MDYTQRIAIDEHIRAALAEDIGHGDLSTQAILPHARKAHVRLICKQDGILAGTYVFERVFAVLDPQTQITWDATDGAPITCGDTLATISGDARVLLTGERCALNYLQRMSGIATKTHTLVTLLDDPHIQLVDTRKTTPGMRLFEKEAVRIGGGDNHRFGLFDAVMLKDNHIDAAGGIQNAVEMARKNVPFVTKIEVETESLDMVREALKAHADIIMLDNMDHETMQQAAQLIGDQAIIECSGNVDETTIKSFKGLPVDIISCGALTHSAGILDMSMKHLVLEE